MHIPSRKTSGRITFHERVEENELVESALQQVARNVQQVRLGLFPSAPAKPASGGSLCRENCDFAAICRVSTREHPQSAAGRFGMNPTSEQKIAIQTQGRALLVEAGAGTGKTWVLVQRFLHLLATNPGWDSGEYHGDYLYRKGGAGNAHALAQGN